VSAKRTEGSCDHQIGKTMTPPSPWDGDTSPAKLGRKLIAAIT